MEFEYKEMTLETLEEFLDILGRTTLTTPCLINEGRGWIPFEQSEAFDKAIKDSLK